MQNNKILLFDCTPEIIATLLKGESHLLKYLGVKSAPSWSNFGTAVFEYALQQIKNTPEAQSWWTYLIIHKKTKTLIGTCGYKGLPTKEETVEIGYEIAPAFRQQGLATLVAGLLTKHAFRKINVATILAHTLPVQNASCVVLKRNGFRKTAEVEDPEDGVIWRWELNKP